MLNLDEALKEAEGHVQLAVVCDDGFKMIIQPINRRGKATLCEPTGYATVLDTNRDEELLAPYENFSSLLRRQFYNVPLSVLRKIVSIHHGIVVIDTTGDARSC